MKDKIVGWVFGAFLFVAVTAALMVVGGWVKGTFLLPHPPKPIPQERGRYQLLANGDQIVKLDTATGHAWTLEKLHWMHKWQRVADDSEKVWYFDPKTDSLTLEPELHDFER